MHYVENTRFNNTKTLYLTYIYYKYSKNTNIVKYYCNLKYLFSILIYFKILLISVMQSRIFSIITLFFSVKKHFFLVSVLKTVVLLIIFVETVIHIIQDSLMDKKIYMKKKS